MADKKISALTASSTPLAGTEVLPIVQSSATVKVAVSDLTAGRAVAMGSGSSAGNGSAYSTFTLNSSSAGGFDLNIQSAGVGRWVVSKTATVDDFFIYRYTDAGSYAGNPLQISRANGNVRLENNLVIGTSGNGIDFSATPGTGTSELLADYEEGTWTPTITGLTLGNASGVAFDYVKVGDIVTVTLGFVWGSTTSSSGTWEFSVPFAASTGGGGSAYLLDSGTAEYMVNAGIATVSFGGVRVGTDTTGFVSNTTPFTWAVNDRFSCAVTYRSA
jgi:hypothetical protein